MMENVGGRPPCDGYPTMTPGELGRVMSRAVVPWIGTSLRVDTNLPTWGKSVQSAMGRLRGVPSL